MFIKYRDGDQPLEGYFAAPRSAGRRPGVLIAPSWMNVTSSLCARADQLADLDYAVFVVDALGAGVRPAPPQCPLEVIRPLMTDRLAYRQRMLAGATVLENRPECDGDRVAAIGYCFGGCGVLEFARSGAPLRGVVSLHGVLTAPLPAQRGTIKAKVLVLHGDADPVVPLERLLAFCDEMRQAQANWQVILYSDASHGFTGEGSAGAHTLEAAMHPQAERRSWQTMVAFLEEVLE
ncbi:MAG TPA: dienelactone hydrolase family protein [Phycisphaerae bacterium]|nr:dienelactone hydrolase family protein [Phycisphaerae bacterium]